MSKKWLITGASGLLGYALCRYIRDSGDEVVAVAHGHGLDLDGVEEVRCDLFQPGAAAELLQNHDVDCVVHCAGITNVDQCEAEEEKALQIHGRVSGDLAIICAARGLKMVYISTDHLWDGTVPMVREEMAPKPLNAYARTKLAGEELALAGNPGALIVRTNFYGPGRPWRKSFSDWIVGELSAGRVVKVFTDVYFTPICLSKLCPALVDLVFKNATGIYNVAGKDRVSKYEFALRLARVLGFPQELVQRSTAHDAGLKAIRPTDMSLSTDKVEEFLGMSMPRVDDCLNDAKGWYLDSDTRRLRSI